MANYPNHINGNERDNFNVKIFSCSPPNHILHNYILSFPKYFIADAVYLCACALVRAYVRAFVCVCFQADLECS